jgi:hypothetical protein
MIHMMSPESLHKAELAVPHKSAVLAQSFRELTMIHEDGDGGEVFMNLERELRNAGFELATQDDVRKIFNDNTLICRSELFTKVIDTITAEDPLLIANNETANMCIMASGTGFKTAMQEGFSGRDVDGIVKTVITFKPEHLRTRSNIPTTDELWQTKPKTAQVSLIGSGELYPEDITMVSFRFPIRLYPEELLSETERDLLENEKITFIVRHYHVSKNERAVH